MSERPVLRKRKLGSTDLELSELGMGCAPIGGLHAPVSEEDARSTLGAAWDCGVRYFDTSPWYGHGLSELRVGAALRERPRPDWILSTKVGRTFYRPYDPDTYRSDFWAGGLPFDYRFDYTYDGIMRSYEQSLMRLGLNRIEMLLIHDLDIAEIGSRDLVDHHFRDLERSGWRALETLRDHGEVRALGAGVNILGTIPEMLKRFDLDFVLVAMPYTLLDQAPLDEEFPLCADRGVGIVIGSPFASGILVTGTRVPQPLYNYTPASPEIIAKTKQIEAICARYNVSLRAAAIQFPLRHPVVASVIAGAISPIQAHENFQLAAAPVPDSLWAELRAERLIHADSP